MIPLELDQVVMRFGGLVAVDNVTLKVNEGEIFALIGPNGAGKTTLFNIITGIYTPTSGSIRSFGRSIVGKDPVEITRAGFARTFQNIRLFRELSVETNLIISMDQRNDMQHGGVLGGILLTPWFSACERKKRDMAGSLLEKLGLEKLVSATAGGLSYGDQRKVEIARALATGARVIFLDEPAAGLNGQETKELTAMIRQLRDAFRLTVILIEHDMRMVMDISDRIAVLDHGVKIAEGTPENIKNDPAVIAAYLGVST